MQNIEDTVEFFRTRYEADVGFRARVDQSVRRILRLKHRICPDFSLEAAVGIASATEDALNHVGRGQAEVARMAQDALTLLYPSAGELALRLPRPPRLDEDMIIFTDAREARECDACSSCCICLPRQGNKEGSLHPRDRDQQDQRPSSCRGTSSGRVRGSHRYGKGLGRDCAFTDDRDGSLYR